MREKENNRLACWWKSKGAVMWVGLATPALTLSPPFLSHFSPATGLRSSRVGEQCEAIVRFPVLVDRYPFPVLINAAFLKLSDLFRTG